MQFRKMRDRQSVLSRLLPFRLRSARKKHERGIITCFSLPPDRILFLPVLPFPLIFVLVPQSFSLFTSPPFDYSIP